MNTTDLFNPLRQLFSTTKNLINSYMAPQLSQSQLSQKEYKDNINDITRDSQVQLKDSSILTNQTQLLEEEPLCQRKIRKILSNKKVFFQKSHQNVLYYDFNGNQIDRNAGEVQYQLQEKQSKKRVVPFTQTHFFNIQNSILNKYEFLTSQQRLNQLDEILLVNSQQTRKLRKVEENRNKTDWTINKVIIREKGYNENERKVSYHDLPNLRNYSINYDCNILYDMTPKQMKNMENVIIFNAIGMIEFFEPLSLYQVDLNDCLEISRRMFNLKYFEWRRKKFQITIFKQSSKDLELLEIFSQNAAKLGLTRKKINQKEGSITFTSFQQQ